MGISDDTVPKKTHRKEIDYMILVAFNCSTFFEVAADGINLNKWECREKGYSVYSFIRIDIKLGSREILWGTLASYPKGGIAVFTSASFFGHKLF